jgi:hypothetical protein
MSSALDDIFNDEANAAATSGDNEDRSFLTPGDYLLEIQGLFVDRSDDNNRRRGGQLYAIGEVNVKEVLESRTVDNPWFDDREAAGPENLRQLTSLPAGTAAKIFFDLQKNGAGKWTKKGSEDYKRLMAFIAAALSIPDQNIIIVPSQLDMSDAKDAAAENGAALVGVLLRVNAGIGKSAKGACYNVFDFQAVG